MPSLGGAASGFATGAGIGSFVPGIGTLVGGGIGALFGGLFGHGKKKEPATEDDKLAPYLKQLQGNATDLRGQADEMHGLSGEALSPAIQIIKNLLSANPQAVMAATAPERGRVIDQYDTARKSISQFGPRGGGTTSALAEGRMNEASQLADITNMGRREAVGQGLQAGFTAEGLGLSADQLASADLGTIIQALLGQSGQQLQGDLAKRGQNMGALTSVGTSLGSLLGLYLTRKNG